MLRHLDLFSGCGGFSLAAKQLTTQSQVKLQAELEPGIWQDEQLHQLKQPLPSAESSISQKLPGGDENSPLSTESGLSPSKELSILCIVKQPKQPEAKGVIRKDEGDRFLVETDGKEISVSKLFVYPIFSKSVGQISPTKKISPPSTKRRKQRQGKGYIEWKPVKRGGKEYKQYWYHYEEWRDGDRLKTR